MCYPFPTQMRKNDDGTIYSFHQGICRLASREGMFRYGPLHRFLRKHSSNPSPAFLPSITTRVRFSCPYMILPLLRPVHQKRFISYERPRRARRRRGRMPIAHTPWSGCIQAALTVTGWYFHRNALYAAGAQGANILVVGPGAIGLLEPAVRKRKCPSLDQCLSRRRFDFPIVFSRCILFCPPPPSPILSSISLSNSEAIQRALFQYFVGC